MKVSAKHLIAFLSISLLASCGEAEPPAPALELSFEETLQIQLIEAQPGDIIEVPAGTHNFVRSLSLTVPNITIRGAGMDESILSFSNQAQGAEGLLVTADDFMKSSAVTNRPSAP